MPTINLTQNLRDEYQNLFDTCQIKTEKLSEIETIITRILNNQIRYETVSNELGIPWYFISVIHNMESSLNFNSHLHNGDPLSSRTTHVPAGRPLVGNPPFTWEQSAEDSLTFQRLDQWSDWSLPGILYKIEEYNGWGYRKNHPEVLSPYLWSSSNNYSSGKYVADGRWSNTAVSNQIGSAVILRRMAEKRIVIFDGETIPKKPFFYYSTKRIEYGEQLQQFLNQFPGIRVLVDGVPGQKTSDAFKLVTGNYLHGDTRI
jgi:lysozyme family protein